MRGGMKMLMISGRGGYNGGTERDGRMEYGKEMDARFRDRRGREHYDNGRFAPMRSEMDEMEDNYGPENRRYRRYSDGRFAPRSEYGEMEWSPPFVPPVYEGGDRGMNPIGFVPNQYGTYATHHHYNEMENRSGSMERGGATWRTNKLTPEMAEEWMESLENEDGTRGPHWKLDEVKRMMHQKGIDSEPYEFAAVMNALYSDYCKIFQKHNVNKPDMYMDMASAWINDRDAVKDKAAAYYMHIARN